MNWLVLTFVAAFAASAMLAVGVRAAALRLGAIDQPDGKRKLHPRPVARWGGIGVYLALCVGLAVAARDASLGGAAYRELALVLALAAGVVCLFGAVDDRWCLSPHTKLLLQILAVAPIVCCGYWMKRLCICGYPIDLGWVGAPLTILWLLGCINALNLLDGMDGLAGTIGALTAAMIAVLATGFGHPHVAAIAVILAASLAGFLVHNLPPARIFLGDSGSMVIGLVLGVLALQSAMKTPTTLAIALPAVIMSLPMIDTVLAIVRRKLTGRCLDAADREHIHHRLLDRGFTPWQALWVLAAFCLATGGAAAISAWLRNEALAWIAMAALIAAAIHLRLFGHHELALIVRGAAALLGRIERRLEPGDANVSVAGESEIEAVWSRAVQRARSLRAHRIEAMWRDGEGRACRCGWIDPRGEAPGKGLSLEVSAARGEAPGEGWSLEVSASRGDGRSCVVRSAGAGAVPAAESDIAVMAAVAAELLECREAASAERIDPASIVPFTRVPEHESKAA